MEPAKFRAYLEAEMGKRAAELVTVAPGDDKGGAPAGNKNAVKGQEESTGATVAPVDSGTTMSPRKEKNLRAILRAPEVVQTLYRDGLVSQTVTVRTGTRSVYAGRRVADTRRA
jgi:hypothetical protein